MKLLMVAALVMSMFGIDQVDPQIARVCPVGIGRCSTGFYVGNNRIVTSMKAGLSPMFLLDVDGKKIPGILKDVSAGFRAMIIQPSVGQTNYEHLQICEAGSVHGGESVAVYGIPNHDPVVYESLGNVWRIDSEIMFLDAFAPLGFVGAPVVIQTRDARCIGGIVQGVLGGWTIASVITGSAYLD